ncbi:MAG: protein phosphatase 2C domain-containing protein [Cyanobium sp.]
MSVVLNRWTLIAPASRRGASHQRQGLPCQDASAAVELRSRDNLPVTVMAVADGHGGEAFPFSDVGSRLACDRALAEIGGAILRRPLAADDLAGWQAWWQEELPRALHGSWHQAIQRHWQRLAREAEMDAEAAGYPQLALEASGFRPHLFGTTLGVVVMTPGWWGHTGLGDWDLMRLWGPGEGEIVSCEPPAPIPDEVTASLAHDRAWELFRSRTALHPVRSGERPFALVLSTDGLRKACRSDADLLGHGEALLRVALAGLGAAAGEGLEASLEALSAGDPGDDLSVAMAVRGRLRWDPPGTAPEEIPWSAEPPAPALDAAGSGHSLQPRLADDPGLEEARRRARQAREDAAKSLAKQEELVEESRGGLPGPVVLLLVVAALALAWPLLTRLMLGVAPPVAPEVGLRIQDELLRLCRSPGVMQRNLRSRREVFDGLILGRLDPSLLQADASRDPLAALIASSFDPASRSMRIQETIAGYPACPALREELERQWRVGAPPTPAAEAAGGR